MKPFLVQVDSVRIFESLVLRPLHGDGSAESSNSGREPSASARSQGCSVVADDGRRALAGQRGAARAPSDRRGRQLLSHAVSCISDVYLSSKSAFYCS